MSDGEVESHPDGSIEITGAPDVTLLISNVTSFNGFENNPSSEGRDYKNDVAKRIAKASSTDYGTLLDNH